MMDAPTEFKHPALIAAQAAGHALEFDPPITLGEPIGRWTCTACGEAVLIRGETVWGGALAAEGRCRP